MKNVIFLTKNTLGSGNDELGNTLIKSYFLTLSKAEEVPSHILAVNAGVKLFIEDSEVLESIKELYERGCEIVLCGTCVNFYKLQDTIQYGDISNMGYINDILLSGVNVITI